MRIDFSGAKVSLKYLDGLASPQDVFQHPAYQAVSRHACQFSNGIEPSDLDKALAGRESSFYDLEDPAANRERIDRLWKIIEANEGEWIKMARAALARVFPTETTAGITIYPILGYDMGIASREAIAMNLNTPLYLDHPDEFLYERHHSIPVLKMLETPAQWRSMFALMLQNDGYAVYVPWRLRQKRGQLTHSDYQVLHHSEELARHIDAFFDTYARFHEDVSRSWEVYMEMVFGPQRLAYRVGAELVRRIGTNLGSDAVRTAFYLGADEFLDTYQHLLRSQSS